MDTTNRNRVPPIDGDQPKILSQGYQVAITNAGETTIAELLQSLLLDQRPLLVLSAQRRVKLRNARCAKAHAAPPAQLHVAPRGAFVCFNAALDLVLRFKSTPNEPQVVSIKWLKCSSTVGELALADWSPEYSPQGDSDGL